jgi:cytochrome c oxidase cbb3-type subunit 2
MNFGPLLFFGIFLSFALSWAGMILLPQLQVGQQKPVTIQATGQLYPVSRSGAGNQGKEVYRSLGCAACHTQQVRQEDVPAWGKRFTVAQDYLYEQPVLLGSQRVGPDLANIGPLRDATWHLLHLYNPKTVVPKSTMPAYRFLFEKRKISGGKSPDALQLPEKFALNDGIEVVPTRDAYALVAYLQSLRSDVPVLEATLPTADGGATNAAADTATNAVPDAADTNSAPTNPAVPTNP